MTTQTHTPPETGSASDWRRSADEAIAALGQRKDGWARLPLDAKLDHLRALRVNTAAEAQRWVRAACAAKGLDPESALAGEEWTSGPWALLFGINRLIETLEAVARTGSPRLRRKAVHTRPDGQVVVDVFPQNAWDRLLLSGVSAQVWMQPGVTATSLADTMAVFYKQA